MKDIKEKYKEILNLEGNDWLPQKDLLSFSKFLGIYYQNISPYYGKFNYKKKSFKSFCLEHKITFKGKQNKKDPINHFWFNSKTPKVFKYNDYAFNFFKHIRNSFCHRLIKIQYETRKKEKYYIFRDIDTDGVTLTMGGKIREDLFWELLWKLYMTKDKDVEIDNKR